MDRDIAIKAERLSKLYRLGVKDEANDSLASAMMGFLKSPIANYRKYRSLYDFRDFDASDPNALEKMPENLEPASVLIFAIFSMVELLVNEAGYSESEMRGIVEEALELAAEPSTPRVTH